MDRDWVLINILVALVITFTTFLMFVVLWEPFIYPLLTSSVSPFAACSREISFWDIFIILIVIIIAAVWVPTIIFIIHGGRGMKAVRVFRPSIARPPKRLGVSYG